MLFIQSQQLVVLRAGKQPVAKLSEKNSSISPCNVGFSPVLVCALLSEFRLRLLVSLSLTCIALIHVHLKLRPPLFCSGM